jgi:hypothetical protein
MNPLSLILQALVQSFKRAWLLPQTLANALKKRRLQVVQNEQEVERLDRLRNPSNYRGR